VKSTSVLLGLEVHLREDGAVKSSHRPWSEKDQGQMEAWPSGGQVQVAHALFVEALRREAYTMMISQLSCGKDPEDLTPEGIEALIRAHWGSMLDRFARSAAEEALRGLALAD
jgi:hypothetical protein